VIQEPTNHANVSFVGAPEVFPILAGLARREDRDGSEDQQQQQQPSASASQVATLGPSHYAQQFQIDFSTTVEDLMAAIGRFLRDNKGVRRHLTFCSLRAFRTCSHCTTIQERPELPLEAYGLFLLRADALDKEHAILLEPASLVLPLGLSLEVLHPSSRSTFLNYFAHILILWVDIFRIHYSSDGWRSRSPLIRPARSFPWGVRRASSSFLLLAFLRSLFTHYPPIKGAGGVSCRVVVPTKGVQVKFTIGPDDVVQEIKARLRHGLIFPTSQVRPLSWSVK
jgi:hypothetical protein